jgi:hypothetical protein
MDAYGTLEPPHSGRKADVCSLLSVTCHVTHPRARSKIGPYHRELTILQLPEIALKRWIVE